jgi:hypothetical protein
MKNWYIISVTMILYALIACSKSNDLITDPSVPAKATHGADTVLIGFYDTIRIPDRNLTLTLDTVYDDSRCPVNAMCIWAGAYEVGLNMTSDGKVQQFKLSTYPGQVADTILHGIEIKVLDLLPYPDIRKPIIPSERQVKIGLFW